MEKRFKSFRLRKHATTGNIVDRIKDLESSASDRFNEQARAQSLDVVSERTGTLIADALVSPAADVTSIEPTDSTFTGAAMGGEGWTFGSTVYHFVAVASGALQAGFNYLGKLIAGAGAVTLDADGINIAANSSFSTAASLTLGDAELYQLSSAGLKSIYLQNNGADTREITITADSTGGGTTTIAQSAGAINQDIYIEVNNGVKYSQIFLNESNISLNNNGDDVDTTIKGDTTTIATFDAGLEAVGIGGAAESGKIAKFTGDVSITSDLAVGDILTVEDGAIINNAGGDSDTQIKGDTDANLFRTDASTDRVGIGTATPATKLDVNGTITGTGLVIGGATLAVIDEGTYTPTITGVTNVAASTAQTCFYLRVGTKVTVWGGCAIDPTAAGNTVFGISLPVASNLALARNLVGHVARAGASDEIGTIEGDTTNDRANVTYTAAVTTNHNVVFNFSYTII